MSCVLNLLSTFSFLNSCHRKPNNQKVFGSKQPRPSLLKTVFIVNKGYHQYHFEMEIYLEKSILWRQFAVNIINNQYGPFSALKESPF